MADFKEIIKKFPIGAWGSPCPDSINNINYITEENYKLAKECGLRLLCTLYEIGNIKYNKKALEMAEKQGIGLILNDRDFFFNDISYEEGKKKIEIYKQYSSFVGISVRDEPGIDEFDKFKKVIEKFKDCMGNNIFYTNLMPLYATNDQIMHGCAYLSGNPDVDLYKRYLNDYIEKVDIPLLSYDFYPFRKEKGWADDRYFLQLYLAREYSNKKNIPFWCFIQVVSWQINEIRSMTFSEILWQVSTALACGAKGIQYFTFITPIDDNSEFFGEAMLDRNHKPTKLYNYVKEVNKHLVPCGNILINYKHLGISYFGDTIAPVYEKQIVKPFENYHFSGDNYIVGYFEKKDKKAIYCVNTSLFNEEKITFDLPLKNYRIIKEGVEEIREFSNLTLNFAPGEGVLIEEA